VTESTGRPPRPLSPRLSAGVITADLTRLGAELEHLRGSAIFDRVDPAKNLDLLIRELLHPVRQPAGRTPEEVSDGKQ
jgi:hypothetical protein